MQSYYIHSYSNMLVLKMYLLIGKFLLDFSMTVINSFVLFSEQEIYYVKDLQGLQQNILTYGQG